MVFTLVIYRIRPDKPTGSNTKLAHEAVARVPLICVNLSELRISTKPLLIQSVRCHRLCRNVRTSLNKAQHISLRYLSYNKTAHHVS